MNMRQCPSYQCDDGEEQPQHDPSKETGVPPVVSGLGVTKLDTTTLLTTSSHTVSTTAATSTTVVTTVSTFSVATTPVCHHSSLSQVPTATFYVNIFMIVWMT